MFKKICIVADIIILIGLVGMLVCAFMGEPVTPVVFGCVVLMLIMDWITNLIRDITIYQDYKMNLKSDDEDEEETIND